MEAADYIRPVEFKYMLEQAEKLAKELEQQDSEANTRKIQRCDPIALYNMLQETKENEDLSVILVDCRARHDFDENHILEAISIPYNEISDVSVQAAISSSVCNLPIDVEKHFYLLFYGESNEVQIVSGEYRRLSLPLRMLSLEDSFEVFHRLFPFMTSSSPTVCHGVLPICLIPQKLYISAQAIDAPLKSLLSVKTVIDITSDSFSFHDIALNCFNSGVEVVISACQSHFKKGGIAIVVDTVYDRIGQLLGLFLFVRKIRLFSHRR